ncbi:MAG TPA: chemotaxis protein CheW [Myxococcales bacterium]|nr:chemotaxis protein CheW [Myxococcales bacterium]
MRLQAREESGFAPELNELLMKRAERARKKPVEVEEENVLWLAEFPVGEETCAISLEALRAAVPLKMVTAIPLSPPHVIGILRFQGQIVTALSLASLLGGRGWREDPAVLLVVDPGFGHLVALDCERIPKPIAVPHTLVEEARARSNGAVTELTLPGMRQVNLLDLMRLMDRRHAQEKR